MTFIYTLQETSVQFHQMKRKLLQHIMIQFYRTFTTYKTEDIAYCTIEEADQRIIRHVTDCAKNNFQNIVVCTGDTDVLFLLISVLPLIQKIKSCNIICKFGIGDNQRYYNVGLLSKELGEDVSTALPFFHAFTCCDTVSSFYNYNKLQFFDARISYSEKKSLKTTFQELCNELTHTKENRTCALERFVIFVYYPKKNSTENINLERMNAFTATPNCNLRLLPFSKSGFLEHITRAALQSGWLWKEGEKNVMQQDSVLWGWVRREDRLMPNWQLNEPSITMNDICKTCTCSSKCRSCRCSKSNINCLPFCGCKNKCENKIIM